VEDNIKMNFKETDFESVDLIHLAQDRVQFRGLMSMDMYLRIP